MDYSLRNAAKPLPTEYPQAKVTTELLGEVKNLKIDYSTDGPDRLIRSHGHTLREIAVLKKGELTRLPDIIVWPSEFLLFLIFNMQLRRKILSSYI